MPAAGDEVRVEVVGVFEQRLEALEGEDRQPLLVVRDGSERALRIPISSCEGLAIHVAVEEHVALRPLTHDLAVRLLDKFSATLDRVVIDDVSEGTYYATLYLRAGEGDIALAARPGDAVALALRAEVPIHVTEEVFARAVSSDSDGL